MKIIIRVLVLSLAAVLCGTGGGSLHSLPVRTVDQVINYPNPFDARLEKTTISYRLEKDASVRIEIYDLLGYPVKDMLYRPGESGGQAGENRISWDGGNAAGQKVAKGGYICRINVEYDDSYAYAVRKIGVIH